LIIGGGLGNHSRGDKKGINEEGAMDKEPINLCKNVSRANTFSRLGESSQVWFDVDKISRRDNKS